ncbi:Leukotriene-B(4) omega-hydroxylase 2 [Seminavis robusta]|uniref:Leukotriene-B(4) omega-hydroxylase 2 n=1 Tax=Seminavis robusta TaxID=568900 RepID=A0A9N8HM73_9STRA|nr:Leukotriene-B(4) omega-hydroxylase 2 [Seminavis robusta]|eukprot:Sro883_g215500.1 Leukotriene-B(4) omega-hydroxylase 2 (511) ;mRNA; f:31359-32891
MDTPQKYSPMFLFLASAVAILITALIQVYRRLKPYPVDKSIPGPPREPFLGILRFLMTNFEDWPNTVHQCSEKYQQTWGGPMPYLGSMQGAYFILTDDKNIEHILSKNFESYEKGKQFQDAMAELLGNGIIGADGSTWYRHRKIASRMFSANLLREASKVTLKKVSELSHVLQDAADTGKEVDIQDLFFRLTFHITSAVAFGVEYGSIQQEKQHPFPLAFDEMQVLLLQRFQDPLFPLKRYFSLTHRERKIQQLKVVLDRHAKEVIQSRRRTAKDGKLGPDLLSRFIDYANTQNDPISDEELRDVVMNFMLAGRDTTAAALSWTFYELSNHPEVVEKVLQEANQICGTVVSGDNNDGDYSYEAIGKLEYVHAVVMEVLRLHPSVPAEAKYAVHDDVLPDGTFIPKGAVVGYPPYAMGRNTRIWGSDANEFKPSRFLNRKEPTPFQFPVFNAGRRLCLGKPMALNTLKLTVAYLVQRFELKDTQGHDGTYKWNFILKMKGGFPIQVTARQP